MIVDPHRFEGQVDLSVSVDGLQLPNPFIIASGPPGTNANVISKAFDEGWGAVVCKTLVLDASRIINVAPRYARMRAASASREVLGWENIELITDRPFETWLDEFRQLKDRYPDRVLIASIMEEYNRDAWFEIVQRCEETGIDGFELNFSCPHGLPERRMGSAMGQDPEILQEVCGWVREAATKPVWAKLTPNITRIQDAGAAALAGGATGLSAINTILSVMSINLDTLRPEPTVEGYSTPGGYSGKAIRPIALRMVMELAQMIADTDCTLNPGQQRLHSLSAIGGVETGEDAAQYLLVGADTVQVCTGVMIHGYKLIHELKAGLAKFMLKHGFDTIDAFRGASLPYFTTHSELVQRQHAAKARRAAALRNDNEWSGENFVQQSQTLLT